MCLTYEQEKVLGKLVFEERLKSMRGNFIQAKYLLNEGLWSKEDFDKFILGERDLPRIVVKDPMKDFIVRVKN